MKLRYILITPFLLFGCSWLPPEDEFIDVDSLHTISNFPIGSAVRFVPFKDDPALQRLQKHHFDSYTAGNDMKMNSIMPEEGVYDFSLIDAILAYTQETDQRLFGHNLIWHSSTPNWVKKKAQKDPEWLSDFMKRYIYTYVGRYRGAVHGWDVVNEGLRTKGGGYREDSIWYEVLGSRYIEQAFHYAHEADPEAVLFYNDFNTERDLEKFNFMIDMVEDFIKRGVPISGIGFQMHIRMDIPNEVIASTLRRAADTGLQIHLSEVDIIFNHHDDTRGGGVQKLTTLTPKMEQAQAQKYYELALMYQKLIPADQQYGITLWGFNDRDTWIRPFFGIQDWPTIYDERLQPKPALYGFLKGLR